MAAQVKCNPPKVGFSATQDNFKCLRLAEEGKSNAVTVRVTRKWEEFIVDEEIGQLYHWQLILSLHPDCDGIVHLFNGNRKGSFVEFGLKKYTI
ncbi:hypothetical protein MKW92_023725 [Papaver armeniacum]|nr:hypothetical protein MKW92_023725 [Papaver armeniacum]